MVSEPEYFQLIYRKTACLFHVSMRLGAVLANVSDEVEDQLGDYGRNLGVAFQIVDDVLDLTSSESALGKPVASDLREGKATLPVIHAYHAGTPQERALIDRVLADQSFEHTSHAQILDVLERHGSVDYALAAAFRYAELARGMVAELPESDERRALLWMPDFVVARDR